MKKLFFGLAVAVVALSASAFTKSTTLAVGDKYVQDSDGNYNYISNTDYSLGVCSGADLTPCVVEITAAGAANNIQTQAPFDDAEIALYTSGSNPYLSQVGTTESLFVR